MVRITDRKNEYWDYPDGVSIAAEGSCILVKSLFRLEDGKQVHRVIAIIPADNVDRVEVL